MTTPIAHPHPQLLRDADAPGALAALVGAAYSALAITPQASHLAPNRVREALARFAPYDADHRIDLVAAGGVADFGDAGTHASGWLEAVAQIEERATAAHASGAPLVIGIGGDHSVAVPLVRASAQRASTLGVIQIDIHHDVRALDNGPSNGTPFRMLIEDGIIEPTHLVQLGIHPFANRPELGAWCDDVGVHHISLADMRSQGMRTVATWALSHLAHCDAIHLSVDIDVLDRVYAPGTAAALPGGLTPYELQQLVTSVVAHPRCIAMDLVEFDPERDLGSTTAYNAANILLSALSACARHPR